MIKLMRNKEQQSSITIRDMTDGDAAFVLRVHYDAVHVGTGTYYPSEKLDIWSPPLHEDSVEDFLFNPDDEIRIVAADEAGQIIGFGCLVLAENELRACYVDPAAVRRGAGALLVAEIEKRAREYGLKFLEVTSSLNAEPFYEAQGYKMKSRGVHMLRGNVELPCVYMRKEL